MLKASLTALLDVVAMRFVMPAIERGRANVEATVRRAVVLAIALVAGGLLALIGFIFLLVALTLVLTPYLGPAGAAGAVGGGVVLLGALVALIATRRSAPPAPQPVAASDPLGALIAGLGSRKAAGGPARGAETEAAAEGGAGSSPLPAALALTAGALLAGIVLGRRI
ncbi:phage holin family protein [Pseudoxanthobacter sp.]|uniref:phage holin family protein n=1 Tax=Pseudoxanthobacter sp. TaxID=1925742 RepID=UPI002FE1FA8E